MLNKILFLLALMLIITSCDNSEKEARKLLNESIKSWESNDIETAESKFDYIEKKFIHTKTATDSMKERERLKELYKQKHSIEQVKQKNKGVFSRQVITDINNYYQQNGTYPESLTKIDLFKKKEIIKYLSLCGYEKAFFESGYQLDCKTADISFNEDWVNFPKRNSAITRLEQTIQKVKKLSDFPRAITTWGEKLNPTDQIPAEGFSAFYINTNNPTDVIHKELVKDLSINYVYNKFHKIMSEDFGAYWVGYVHLTKDEVKTISISQGWSKTRLIIDGVVVYKGDSDKEFQLLLNKGRHKIEVEYINNWHTTEFHLALLDVVEKLSANEIKSRLTNNIPSGNYEIYYAGVYESDNQDLSVILNIEKTSKQIVLFLSSYSTVKWYISNPFMTEIRAIVYGSYSPGITIVGDIDKSTLLLHSNKRLGGSYGSGTKSLCNCQSGRFSCGKSGPLSTKKYLDTFGSASMTGFSGKYSASSLKVPEIITNSTYVQEAEKRNLEIEQLRKDCARKNNPDFETIFDDN